MLLGILDHFAIGIMLVDERGGVLHANSGARALLGEEIRLSDRASDTFPFGRIRGCIRSVISRSTARTLALRSTATDRPLFVTIAPVQHQADDTSIAASWPSRAALVVLCDLDGPASLPVGSVIETYGLTDADARVAQAASGGAAIGEIAGRLCLSVNTVKTHPRRIYEKTGTKRQAELARVMAMIGFARTNAGDHGLQT